MDKSLQFIVTERDFGRQVLYDNGDEAYAVHEPEGCIDEYVASEAEKLQGEGKEVLVGYNNVLVHPAIRADTCPRVSFFHYVLAEAMDAGKLTGKRDQVRVFADAYCQAGFLGCYAWARGIRTVWFADPSEDSMNLAMRSLGFNANLGNVRDKAKRDAFTYTFTEKSQTAAFSVGNPGYLWRGDHIDVMVGVISDVPGVYDLSNENPVNKFVHAAALSGATLYLAHSALAGDLVRSAASGNGAESRIVHTRELPLRFETVCGAGGHPIDKKQEPQLLRKGLIVADDKTYHHLVHVSRITQR